MTASMATGWACVHCGLIHLGVCPRIKRIHADGTVEYHPPLGSAPASPQEILDHLADLVAEKLRQS